MAGVLNYILFALFPCALLGMCIPRITAKIKRMEEARESWWSAVFMYVVLYACILELSGWSGLMGALAFSPSEKVWLPTMILFMLTGLIAMLGGLAVRWLWPAAGRRLDQSIDKLLSSRS